MKWIAKKGRNPKNKKSEGPKNFIKEEEFVEEEEQENNGDYGPSDHASTDPSVHELSHNLLNNKNGSILREKLREQKDKKS
ncbi:unnamed protein product [Caenorhabditis nigoni]